MPCIPCARDLHDECISLPCCCDLSPPVEQASFSVELDKPVRGRPRKEDSEITISAGRKRAAAEYEIDSDEDCEWRGLANAGGGKHPIIGCLVGRQKHRHHGPIKNTSRNEQGNVHRICATCHNRWHAANDSDYNEITNENLPHDPRPMTAQELLFGKSLQ